MFVPVAGAVAIRICDVPLPVCQLQIGASAQGPSQLDLGRRCEEDAAQHGGAPRGPWSCSFQVHTPDALCFLNLN